MATWPSGEAEVCKTSYGGSNPPVASLIIKFFKFILPRSSRGLGRRPFTAVTRVRIPYAVLAYFFLELVPLMINAPVCHPGGCGINSLQLLSIISLNSLAAIVVGYRTPPFHVV